MSTRDQILEVESILFETGDPEVSVKGTITQGFLSYETEIIVNSTQLNEILNQLNRNNDDTDIYELIETVELEDNSVLYSASLQSLANKRIDLMFIENIKSVKEIRA